MELITKEELALIKQKSQKIRGAADEQSKKIKEDMAETLAEVEKLMPIVRFCRYRFCRKRFKTGDNRIHFCRREHQRLENRERTRDRDDKRKVDASSAK